MQHWVCHLDGSSSIVDLTFSVRKASTSRSAGPFSAIVNNRVQTATCLVLIGFEDYFPVTFRVASALVQDWFCCFNSQSLSHVIQVRSKVVAQTMLTILRSFDGALAIQDNNILFHLHGTKKHFTVAIKRK